MESPRGNNTTRICQERELKEISERFIDSIFLNLTVSCYVPLTYLIRSFDWEVGVLVQLSDIQYKIFPKTFIIDIEKVGGTGMNQIKSLYRLNKSLHRISSKVRGIKISNEDFNKLFRGYIYPKTIIPLSEDYWWNDFLDIHHKFPIAENYKLWYGDTFLKTQEFLAREMEGK